jgi:hypothetical protein
MKTGSLVATLGIAILAAAPVAAADTVIGSAGQSNGQSVQSTQQGKNAVSAPNQAILGTSSNTFAQGSGNVASNDQGIAAGAPGGAALIATPGGPGFTQQSDQGVNSLQNGGRVQTSENVLASTQIVGDADLGPTLIIGDVGQGNSQAVNSAQIGASSGHRTQTSTNVLVNTQLVNANVIIGAADQANSQGVNSTQTIPSAKKSTGTDIVGTGLPGINEPGLTVATPTGPVTQNSVNAVVDSQLILD